MIRSRMTVGEVRRMVQQDRAEALATRDPIAIRLAHGRWNAIEQALGDRPDD